jgi:hypothetical protein
VVTLEPELADAWVAACPLAPAGDLPAGPLLRADEMDVAFNADVW